MLQKVVDVLLVYSQDYNSVVVVVAAVALFVLPHHGPQYWLCDRDIL